jgi:hypothetical protein
LGYLAAVRILNALIFCLAVVSFGCGYHVVGRRGSLDGIQRVTIQTFQNSSFEPGYELEMTEAFLQEFHRRGTVELVSDPSQADLVLSGRVLPIKASDDTYSSATLALEYSLVVGVEISAVLEEGTKVTLGSGTFTEKERYLASADIEAARKNKKEALRKVASTLAGQVHDALNQRFTP